MTDQATSTVRRRVDDQVARDFARDWTEAWNSRDPGRILSLCTEQVVWDDPLRSEALKGREPVRGYLHSIFRAFPDLEFALPVEPFPSLQDGKLALYWDREGTMLGPLTPPGYEPTGQRVRFDGLDLLHLEGALVSHFRSRPDARLAQQIGAAPFAGSRGERVAVLAQGLQARRMRRRGD